MRLALVLALVAACGTSEPPRAAARPLDAAPAPPPPPPPLADAAPAPDAPVAKPTAPDPTTEAELEAQAEYMANMFSADEPPEGATGARRPGADLAAQIEEARRAATTDSFEISLTFADPADPGAAALTKIESIYRPGLRRCLRAATFTGGPELALTIAPTGRVTAARVSHGDAIADCVEGQMRTWRFATSERETQLVLQLRVPEPP